MVIKAVSPLGSTTAGRVYVTVYPMNTV